MAGITWEQARKIIDVALATGKKKKMNPLTVAVLDDGGNLVAFAKEGGGPRREAVCRGKAWGAVGMGRSSRALGQMGEERPMFMQALIDASGGKVVPVPGGVLAMKGRTVMGAVGVSGDTSDNDEICAVAGIEAAGLKSKV